MEARKVTFTAKPGTFRDAVRAYKKYKEEKEQRLESTQQRSARRDAFLRSVGAQALRGGPCKEPTRCVFFLNKSSNNLEVSEIVRIFAHRKCAMMLRLELLKVA